MSIPESGQLPTDISVGTISTTYRDDMSIPESGQLPTNVSEGTSSTVGEAGLPGLSSKRSDTSTFYSALKEAVRACNRSTVPEKFVVLWKEVKEFRV